MAYLGVPYRVAYIGENFRTGLIDIIAMIMRPDNTVEGPFSLSELLGIGFQGIYSFNYMNDRSYPEGEYLALVISPTENLRDIIKFTLDYRPYGGAQIIVQPVTQTIQAILGPQTSVTACPNESPLVIQQNNPQILLEPSTIEINLDT